MNLDVYNPANATHLGTLSDVYGISFLDDDTIPGAARFQVDVASTTDLGLLTSRRVVRFRTGATPGSGDIFAAVVQDRPAELVADIEPEPGNTITVVTFECPGLLSWLGYQTGGAVLYPYQGLEGRQQNPRIFGWYAPDFDDSGWSETVTVDGAISSPGWPDASAVAYLPEHPGDTAFYRRTMTAGEHTAGPARMFLVANWRTSVEVWLDSELVLEKPANEAGLFVVDVDYEDLDHQIAVKVSGGSGRWAFTWARLEPTGQAATLDWQEEFYDDTEWTEPSADGQIHTDGWPDAAAVAYNASAEQMRYRRKIAGSTVQPATLSVAAEWQTAVTVYVDGRQVLAKPEGGTGVYDAQVEWPAEGQLSVEVAGSGRWALSWVDAGGGALLRTYDPATTSPANLWLEERAPSREPESQVGTILRRTFDPAAFPDATPWKVDDGGPTDWHATAYDDTAWGTPVVAGQVSTAGWPDAQAVAYQAPPSRARYRRDIVSDAARMGRIYVVAQWQTTVRVFVGGVEVLAKPVGSSGLFIADARWPGVDTQLAVLVAGGGRWALSWMELGADDAPTTALLRTYDDPANPGVGVTEWLQDVEGPPGTSVGFVLDTALSEDSERHSRPWTWDFDGNTDSAGQAWQVPFSRGFPMQTVGQLLDELTSIEGQPEMTPSGLLRLWVRRGQDRTATVTVSSPFSLGLTGRGPQATRWLYQTEGGLGVVVNAQAENELGVVMEQFVQLGSDVDPDSIGRALVGQLARDGDTLDEVEVELPDDVVPYTDVFLGDTVLCAGRDGSGPVRLTSFEYVLEDANGAEVWSATAKVDA